MKKLVVLLNLALLILSSCATQNKWASNYNDDDVYSNPKEDRIAAQIKRQAQLAANKRYNDSISAVRSAQKEKDDANPYYKDRTFKYDDYYDYEYATRVKRFNNGIYGLSYYDNYYTNSYWYNHNPYNYGVSVYNGYSWWGSSYNLYSYNPSINFYSNWGWGCSPVYVYSGYNPYMAGYINGYNNGFQNAYFGNYYGYGNPYFSYGYYGYPYGYYGGYSNYNNGWGYYNSYDFNSSYTYGPRSSHGGNSRRVSNPNGEGKRDSYVEKYISNVEQQQVRTNKFSELEPVRTSGLSEPVRGNIINPIRGGGIKEGSVNGDLPSKTDRPIRNSGPDRSAPSRDIDANPSKDLPIRNSEPVNPSRNPKNQEPVRPQIDLPRFEAPSRQNSMPSLPGNNGGGSPGNNGGGGGSHRPR